MNDMPDEILQMGQRVSELRARPDYEAMSPIRKELEFQKAAFGSRSLNEFMLTYGRDYQIGPDTFAGPRGERHGCYKNATQLALANESLIYVEGKVATCGIAIDHAWCINWDGVVIDPTLEAARADDTFARVHGYFGVPFRKDYLLKAMMANKHYGLLDIISAPKTLPQLVDLGLEAGQQWLLDQKKPIRRKRKAR
jgi:hypothetical protein